MIKEKIIVIGKFLYCFCKVNVIRLRVLYIVLCLIENFLIDVFFIGYVKDVDFLGIDF